MSRKYRETFGDRIPERAELRAFFAAPAAERDKKGNIVYTTEQHYKERCDVNNVIRRYQDTGLLDHVSVLEAKYGDMPAGEFKQMMDMVIDVQARFAEFPLKIRNKFRNDPEAFFQFMEDPANRPEAIAMGLIRSDWPAENDGIGEKRVEPEKAPESP